MLMEWLTPVLQWLGLGIVPFLMLLIVVILIVKD